MVFVGYNPGLESARRGHYYAFHGNTFWRQLNASGLVPREVGFEDDASLMDLAGIGFTDLCPRATTRATELDPAEIREGSGRLLQELRAAAPQVAVFSGKGTYVHFAHHAFGLGRSLLARRADGPQAERIGETVPWVIPSSSGLASRWHARRLELLRDLATALQS